MSDAQPSSPASTLALPSAGQPLSVPPSLAALVGMLSRRHRCLVSDTYDFEALRRQVTPDQMVERVGIAARTLLHQWHPDVEPVAGNTLEHVVPDTEIDMSAFEDDFSDGDGVDGLTAACLRERGLLHPDCDPIERLTRSLELYPSDDVQRAVRLAAREIDDITDPDVSALTRWQEAVVVWARIWIIVVAATVSAGAAVLAVDLSWTARMPVLGVPLALLALARLTGRRLRARLQRLTEPTLA